MINLSTITQAQADAAQVNSALSPVIDHIEAANRALNNSRVVFWSFSDERLNAMFAEIGAEKLQALFENHYDSAGLLNDLAERCGIEARAEVGALREIEIVEGVVRVIPLPIVTNIPVPIPEESNTSEL